MLPVAFEVTSVHPPHSGQKPAGKPDREGSSQFADMLDHTSAPDKPAAKDQGPQSAGLTAVAPRGEGTQPKAASDGSKSEETPPKTKPTADVLQAFQGVSDEPGADQVTAPDLADLPAAAKTGDDPKPNSSIATGAAIPAIPPDNDDKLAEAVAAVIVNLPDQAVVSRKPKSTGVVAKSEKTPDKDTDPVAGPDTTDGQASAPAAAGPAAPPNAFAAVVTPVVDSVIAAPAASTTPVVDVAPATTATVTTPAAKAVVAAAGNENTAAARGAPIAAAVDPTVPAVDPTEPQSPSTEPSAAENTAGLAKAQFTDAAQVDKTSADPTAAVKPQVADTPATTKPAPAPPPVQSTQPAQLSVDATQPLPQAIQPHAQPARTHVTQTQPSNAAPNNQSNSPPGNSEGNVQNNGQAGQPSSAASAAPASHGVAVEIVKPAPSQHEAQPHDSTQNGKAGLDPLQPSVPLQTSNVATPVTNNHTTPAAAPAAAVPVAGIAVEIASKALAGKHSFEIRLDPPELGRIHVRLDVDRNGEISSRVTADRSDTLDLLRRDAPALERALQDAGLKTANNGLQFSLRDHSFGRNDQPVPMSDIARVVVSDESLTAETITPAYRAFSGSRAGVDIRV